MREAIERVIAELEAKKNEYQKESYKDLSRSSVAHLEGAVVGLKLSIDKLKEVLSQHETGDKGQTRSGRSDDTAEQV